MLEVRCRQRGLKGRAEATRDAQANGGAAEVPGAGTNSNGEKKVGSYQLTTAQSRRGAQEGRRGEGEKANRSESAKASRIDAVLTSDSKTHVKSNTLTNKTSE